MIDPFMIKLMATALFVAAIVTAFWAGRISTILFPADTEEENETPKE